MRRVTGGLPALALPALVVFLAVVAFHAPLAHGQDVTPPDAIEMPDLRGNLDFDTPYPVRVLTIETGAMLEKGSGIVGFGIARWPLLDRRLEVTTNTIGDAVGIANLGVKVGLMDDPERSFALVAGGMFYQSYGGLIDLGVQAIAESFSDVTDSEVEVSGWVGYATGSWTMEDGATHVHLALQVHEPTQTKFAVEDSDAGGRGSVEFRDGEDVSTMWGVDRRLLGRRLVLLMEAGWSWSLDEPRVGLGVDAGSRRWRVTAGVAYPGVETDLATDPTDLVVTPVLSVHYRF